jgi:hypothetical protein
MKKLFWLILLNALLPTPVLASDGYFLTDSVDCVGYNSLCNSNPHVFVEWITADPDRELSVDVYEYDSVNFVLVGEPLIVFQGQKTEENKYVCEFDLIISELPKQLALVYNTAPPGTIITPSPNRIIYTDPTEAVEMWRYYNQTEDQRNKGLQLDYNGNVTAFNSLFVNGASAWGSAPFVLGQDVGNRGTVITDMAEVNPKNIYFGWNVGKVHEYAEIFALHEGIAWKNLVLNPHGGNLGVGTKTPRYLIDTGGAYCNGSSWVNASSRELKQDFKFITSAQAKDTLAKLEPIQFTYKSDPTEKTLGFIAEDVPELVATNDRKSLNPMDIIAILTKVVQEQQKTVQEQRSIIADLSKRLAVVENGVKIAKYQD